MSGKVSWLDSCKQESSIHITSDDHTTLCGHQFAACFDEQRWSPYRVSKKRGVCKGCLKIALENHIDFKTWSDIIPERDITEIPHRTQWRDWDKHLGNV